MTRLVFWSVIPGLEFLATEHKFRGIKNSLFTPSIKRRLREFYVAAVPERRRNVTKSMLHVQSFESCCFAYRTCCFFFDVLVTVAVVVAKAP